MIQPATSSSVAPITSKCEKTALRSDTPASARLLQHVLRGLHMHGLAAVAGAQHGHVVGSEAKVLRATSLHKGQGLQRFERGAGEGHPVRVARMGQQFALGVDHGNRAKVLVLQGASAGHFYEWGVLHTAIVEQSGGAPAAVTRLTVGP